MVIQKTVVNTKGIGFLGMLTLVFIVLKLVGTIDWAWYLVLAPLWAPAAIVLGIVAIIFLVVLLFSGYKDWRASVRRNKRQSR